MNFRRLGNVSIALTLMVLAGNVYLNRDRNLGELGVGPEGFPWPTDGLGRVSIGMEGRFRIDLEERVGGEAGSAERIPTMSIVGVDPRPRNEGMAFRNAVVKSYSTESDSDEAKVIARSTKAWLPVTQIKGATTLDRSQLWKMTKPRVRFPGLAGGQEFRLVAEEVLLNSQTNEVHCPGKFELTSPGMDISGTGLRLDPESGELHFGEIDGNLDWKITLDSGEALFGHTDGGGTFGPIADGQHALTLRAAESCYMTLPESTAMPSRLETDGFQIILHSATDSWEPKRLSGIGETFWAGKSGILLGGPVDGQWQSNGELGGLLVDGPILGHTFGQSRSGWVTATGGAHIQAATEQIDLWDRVTLHQPQGQIQSQWAELGPGRTLKAGGEILMLSQHGMVFADSMHTMENPADIKCIDVLAYLAGEELDTVTSPHLILRESGNISGPDGFSINGTQEDEPWNLIGNTLRTSNRNVPILAQANGAVEWEFPGGRIFADQVQVRKNGQISARGNPLLATMMSDGGTVVATGTSCFMSGEKLSLSGNPQADFPASLLGLHGSRCLVRSEIVNREEDGTWVFRGLVVFTGALTGTAQTARLSPDGTLEVTSASTDTPLQATTLDGLVLRGRADWILAHPNGPIEMKNEIDAQATDPTGKVNRIVGRIARVGRTSGRVTGDANIWSGPLHARGHQLWWTSNEFGESRVFLEGVAEFFHPQGQGRAHRIELNPENEVLELHRNVRRPAWMRLEDGRVITADWIRLDTVHMLFSSRNGKVFKAADPE